MPMMMIRSAFSRLQIVHTKTLATINGTSFKFALVSYQLVYICIFEFKKFLENCLKNSSITNYFVIELYVI